MSFLYSFYFPSGSSSPTNLLAASSVLPALCIIAVALRFNLRRLQQATLQIDDWFMVPALLFVIAEGACGIIGVKKGVWGALTKGNHTQSSIVFEGQLLFAFLYFQILALSCIKLGALSFYHRIFVIKSHPSKFDIAVTATVVVVVLWTTAMLIMQSLQCGSHVYALWTTLDDFLLYCNYVVPYGTGLAISNVILDVWIIAMPIPKVFNLHAGFRQKLAISGVFLLALIGLGSSIARLVGWINESTYIYDLSTDLRLEDTVQVFWTILESGVSLIAVNLPSLWSYHKRVSPESMLASVRSIISLRSFRSSSNSSGQRSRNTQASRAPPPPPPLGDNKSIHSASSRANMVSSTDSEGYAMHDVEAGQSSRKDVS